MNLSSSNSLKVRFSAVPERCAEYAWASITRLPARTTRSCWFSSSAVASLLMARRRRASISEGEAWSETISSTCQEAATAAMPPSFRSAMSGNCTPAARSSWAQWRALTRAVRASTMSRSNVSVSRVVWAVSRGKTCTLWLSRLSEGIISCAAVSLRSAIRYTPSPFPVKY